MERARRLQVRGPLSGVVPDLVATLKERGYLDRSVVDHVRCLAFLSGWLETEGLEPDVVDEALIARMVDALHGAGVARKFRPGSFGVTLRVLRDRGLVPEAAVTVGVFDEVLAEYRSWLAGRSMARLTVITYLSAATRFLAGTCDDDPGRIATLSAGDVTRFVAKAGDALSPATVNTVVVGVRSLLRWLYIDGRIDRPLAQATPWLASGALSTPPRGLADGQAKLLLDTCDRGRLCGARDFAVLTVLARLGLRAGEVAAMEVADIDWRRGEMAVRSKGGWRDSLPLPVDVGEAIAAYLQLRGTQPAFPQLFLRIYAPHGQMKLATVRGVVREACERAGIADVGTHRFRHAAACDLLAHGADLPAIGQVLRHRSVATTAMYARVDFASLATIARPWPGSSR